MCFVDQEKPGPRRLSITPRRRQNVGEPSRFAPLNPDSEIGTTDSTDFADFEEVIGDARTNFFVAKLQGVADHNLLYLCSLQLLNNGAGKQFIHHVRLPIKMARFGCATASQLNGR
jgi:hypothetical protein